MRKLLDAARAERHHRVAGEDGGPADVIIAGHAMSVEDLREVLREIDGRTRGLPSAWIAGASCLGPSKAVENAQGRTLSRGTI